ncbi:hypothetical protein B0H14DRAFT_3676963 [Mycena olivaceomarginata]|nr:hypothetical protein B0H14DRAFT_3676963 [Mycena olivaceomarginata]
MSRDEFVDHPGGISSLFFAFHYQTLCPFSPSLPRASRCLSVPDTGSPVPRRRLAGTHPARPVRMYRKALLPFSLDPSILPAHTRTCPLDVPLAVPPAVPPAVPRMHEGFLDQLVAQVDTEPKSPPSRALPTTRPTAATASMNLQNRPQNEPLLLLHVLFRLSQRQRHPGRTPVAPPQLYSQDPSRPSLSPPSTILAPASTWATIPSSSSSARDALADTLWAPCADEWAWPATPERDGAHISTIFVVGFPEDMQLLSQQQPSGSATQQQQPTLRGGGTYNVAAYSSTLAARAGSQVGLHWPQAAAPNPNGDGQAQQQPPVFAPGGVSVSGISTLFLLTPHCPMHHLCAPPHPPASHCATPTPDGSIHRRLPIHAPSPLSSVTRHRWRPPHHTLYAPLLGHRLLPGMLGASESDFQTAPLNLCEDTVFPRTTGRHWRMSALQLVTTQDTKYRAHKVMVVGVRWDLLERKDLVGVVKVIPTNMLSNICNMFCENYIEACLGAPNVVAWDSGGDGENTYKLVHIQSRGYPNSVSKTSSHAHMGRTRRSAGVVDPTKPVKVKKKEKGKGKKDSSDEDSDEEPGSEDEDEDGAVAGGAGASQSGSSKSVEASESGSRTASGWKMWMGFCRFKEKTEQLKMEVRRRGEVVSDEEEALGARKAWRKEREAKEKRGGCVEEVEEGQDQDRAQDIQADSGGGGAGHASVIEPWADHQRDRGSAPGSIGLPQQYFLGQTYP